MLLELFILKQHANMYLQTKLQSTTISHCIMGNVEASYLEFGPLHVWTKSQVITASPASILNMPLLKTCLMMSQ